MAESKVYHVGILQLVQHPLHQLHQSLILRDPAAGYEFDPAPVSPFTEDALRLCVMLQEDTPQPDRKAVIDFLQGNIGE